MIADSINEKLSNGLPKSVLKEMEVVVNVSPAIQYGIDKEFYRSTHDGETDGFKPSEDDVVALIDGVTFRITSKNINKH